MEKLKQKRIKMVEVFYINMITMYDIINYRIEEVMYEKNINYICLFYSFRMQ